MKKTVSVILVLVVALSLTACHRKKTEPMGTYKAYIGDEEFAAVTIAKKNRVSVSYISGNSVAGKYEFDEDDGSVEVKYDDASTDTFTFDKETDTLDYHDGLLTFVYTEDTDK